MFKPLVEKMKESLVQQLGVREEQINLLSSNELKDICIKGVFNNSIRLNAEMTGYPIQLIFGTESNEPVAPPVEKKPVISRKSLFARLFNDLNTFDKVEKVLAFDNNLNFDKLQTSQFLIGSKTYRIAGNDIFQRKPGVDYEANVEFTHKGYYIRRKHNGIVDSIAPMKVIDDTEHNDLSLVVPSLFPNYIDEKYLNSLERDDITPEPPASPATPASGNSSDNNNSSGQNPLYF